MARLSAAAALIVASIGLTVFLVSQGLGKASLWAAVLGLPVAVIAAVAGVWSTIVAIKSFREHATEASLRSDISSDPSTTGEIRQRGNRGTTIAHTGSGDIHVTTDAGGEQQDGPS
jgi:hypothetical protein